MVSGRTVRLAGPPAVIPERVLGSGADSGERGDLQGWGRREIAPRIGIRYLVGLTYNQKISCSDHSFDAIITIGLVSRPLSANLSKREEILDASKNS